MRALLGRLGLGVFAGNPPLPHDFDGTLIDAQANTMGDPGIRLASSRGKRVYRAGGLSLHTFVGPQGGMATDDVLATLGTTRNQRRALGTFRGLPEALPLTPPDPDGQQ